MLDTNEGHIFPTALEIWDDTNSYLFNTSLNIHVVLVNQGISKHTILPRLPCDNHKFLFEFFQVQIGHHFQPRSKSNDF
jgi:AMMECR1 domain-containing protein